MTVRTDWRGRALQGPWYGDYYMPWRDENDRSQVAPGFWADDERGRKWWITETLEWDREWFQSQGAKLPKRIGRPQDTEWISEGGGLSREAYRSARK